ncbi:hypothetical protein CKAH01_08282 [Colletotrichum kahawae]|uniref:BZIP domain-containing protein n=1 Tax=Colletotrichum kahawae TaxID=34407 RepID=A0AAE0D0Q1_COLKA|nr:hypothetical protein CKAH01_08282 [Colletotrichum kahawae]
MSSKIFRIFNPGAPKEDPVQKRRAQLRRAQKSYRDRKEIYTKSLEKEVAQTKTREAELTRQCEQYSGTIRQLAQMLRHHGIDLPNGLELGASCGQHLSHTPLLNQLSPPWTPEESISPQPAQSDMEALKMTEAHRSPIQLLPSDESQASAAPDPSISQANEWPSWNMSSKDVTSQIAPAMPPASRLCVLDHTSIGMDFVLTIESPCLGHLHGDPDNPHKPTGHALTTSAQLFSITATPTEIPNQMGLPAYEKAPKELLNRLLDLSSSLCPEDEITPTQAWEYISAQTNFGRIELYKFQALAGKLREAVKCHGFGAVMDRALFESLVYNALMKEY